MSRQQQSAAQRDEGPRQQHTAVTSRVQPTVLLGIGLESLSVLRRQPVHVQSHSTTTRVSSLLPHTLVVFEDGSGCTAGRVGVWKEGVGVPSSSRRDVTSP